jgi:uncharacterized protein YdaU (DUF1376 family)
MNAMSRAWMPWYIGDYLRDTGHLTTEQHGAYMLLLAHCWQHGAIPISASERAAIAKLTPARWKAISGPLNRFFKADGTQKRVTQELEKVETVSIRRTLAGVNSAIARGVAKQTVSKRAANAQANAEQMYEQKSSKPPNKRADSHNHIEKPSLTAPRPPVANEVDNSHSARPPATARPAGTRAVEPDTKPVVRDVSRMSRAELDQHLMFKRINSPADGPCCVGWHPRMNR